MRPTQALFALFLVGSGTRATAQQIPAGTRVRLTTPETFTGWRVGRITTLSHDSIGLVYPNGESATFALADVGLVDSGGETHRPLWAILSSVATVPAGGFVGLMTAMSVSIVARQSIDEYFDEGLTIGLSGGLVAGIAIAATQKTESWTPVLLPHRLRARLKLRIARRQVVGTLIEQRDDSIVLARNSVHTSYPVASVTDVRLSRGKSIWAGAKFGGLIGAGIGLVTVAPQLAGPNDSYDPVDSDCDPNTASCRYESDLVHAAKYVGGYALAGALAGAVIRRERWVKGQLATQSDHHEPARLLLAPTRDGWRVGVHATF
jgi:hypothetical protein